MVSQNAASSPPRVLPIWPAADAELIRQVHAALDEDEFDAWVESVCTTYVGGENPDRPQLAASFRLVLIGLLAQNWHAGESESPASAPAIPSKLRQIAALHPCQQSFRDSGIGRVPLAVHQWVLARAIEILNRKGVLPQGARHGQAAARHSLLLANLVHKETGETWVSPIDRQYV